jgi:hypothetical protein
MASRALQACLIIAIVGIIGVMVARSVNDADKTSHGEMGAQPMSRPFERDRNVEVDENGAEFKTLKKTWTKK